MTRTAAFWMGVGCVVLAPAWSTANGAEAAEAKWSVVRCPMLRPGLIEQVEKAADLADFEKADAAWQVATGNQQASARAAVAGGQARGGTSALKVDYEFKADKELEYVELVVDAPLPRAGLGLGLWARGGHAGMALRARVTDRTGETHQFDLSRLGTAGWQYAAAPFSTSHGHWGGDNNGRLDYPCKLHSVLADRPRQGFRGKGTFWLDDAQFVRKRRVEQKLRIEVRPKMFGNLYDTGRQVSLRAADTSGAGAVRWSVTDFGGRAVTPARTDAKAGEISMARWLSPGCYRAVAARVVGGGVVERQVFSFGVLPTGKPAENPFVGVGCHFGQGHYPLECMELMRRLGVTEFRDEIGWGNVERTKGRLAMPKTGQALLDHARQVGMKPLLIFDYGNQLYEDGGFPRAAESVAAFARYATWLAERTKDTVDQFEVWNEYSIGCGMRGKPKVQTPETYAAMLKATRQAVQAVRPEATLVGVGGEHSAHHVTFIAGMLRAGAGKQMDAWSVHSYRYPSSPEESGLVEEIRNVIALGTKLGAPPRLWVTEIGWPTHQGPRGVDPRTQACYLTRTYALLRTIPEVEKVHWYDLKDDGLRPEYNENNFGVIRHHLYNCAPKPAALAMGWFARMTAGATSASLWKDGDARAATFRWANGQSLIVAWSAGSNIPAELVSDTEGHSLDPLTVWNLVGTQINSAVRERLTDGRCVPPPARLPVTLTDAPIYIRGGQPVLRLRPRAKNPASKRKDAK